MQTEWDYSILADAYLKRPNYSSDALDSILKKCSVEKGQQVCDVGAGVAHLTLYLARNGLDVVAVEPNDNMRKNGIERTKSFPNVSWVEATGEDTKQSDGGFDFVSFGSSFNVTDRQVTLRETYRILKPRRWFACMWNHRDLEDPIQGSIESIIGRHIEGYEYGSRRENQAEIIQSSGLFENVEEIHGSVKHLQSVDDCVEAWRSHGTLERQAKDKFLPIIDEIRGYLRSLNSKQILIPYRTRGWIAQRKN